MKTIIKTVALSAVIGLAGVANAEQVSAAAEEQMTYEDAAIIDGVGAIINYSMARGTQLLNSGMDQITTRVIRPDAAVQVLDDALIDDIMKSLNRSPLRDLKVGGIFGGSNITIEYDARQLSRFIGQSNAAQVIGDNALTKALEEGDRYKVKDANKISLGTSPEGVDKAAKVVNMADQSSARMTTKMFNTAEMAYSQAAGQRVGSNLPLRQFLNQLKDSKAVVNKIQIRSAPARVAGGLSGYGLGALNIYFIGSAGVDALNAGNYGLAAAFAEDQAETFMQSECKAYDAEKEMYTECGGDTFNYLYQAASSSQLVFHQWVLEDEQE